MRSSIRCAHCKRLVPANPRCKNQTYCGRKECQRARKRKWQRQKMETDSDYRENQRDCQQHWRENNRDYWRNYRSRNKRYCIRNRLRQKIRDRKHRTQHVLAKMDTLLSGVLPITGRCFILPSLAKMDALEVDIIPITVS